MWNIVFFAVLFCAAALTYRYRRPIFAALARFDARNAARKAQELEDRRDRFAHYRRTLQTAEESLEEVSQITVDDARTGQPLKRFLFLGEHFESRNDAEAARRARAVAIAREFYAELDGRSLPRDWQPPAQPAPALPKPDDKITPPRPS